MHGLRSESLTTRMIVIVMTTNTHVQQKIRIEVVRGDAAHADEQFYADMFRLYATTVEKMWGTQYLTIEFFSLLAQVGADSCSVR
jgi:predicted N-acyltransferase